MRKLIQRLARDDHGASVIELALVMPFFAALVMGVADISRAYSDKLKLEQAAYRAIEKVQQYRDTSSTFSTISTEATTAATQAGFSPSTVTIDYFLECNGARQGSYNTTCPNATDVENRWITVDIAATFTPTFSSRVWPGSNADGTYTLHGKAGLRTQ
jgi:Flp pilus assembly protein TadG